MPIVSCPHCGAQRNTSEQRLPRKAVTARCPECQQSFRFDPASLPSSASSREQLSCPNCGLPRSIPAHRNTGARLTVSCRRCQHTFQIGASREAGNDQQSATKLRSIGQLLSASWELFCRRGWGLATLYLLGSLLIFIPLIIAAIYLTPQWEQNIRLFWGGLIGAGSFALLGSAWLVASMFNHICRQDLGIIGAIKRGRQQLWQFALLLLLLGLIVGGGSLLLLIPGIIFSIWFFFCQYVLADEGLAGLQALERSCQLVQGQWWAVFSRFLLLLVATLGISALTARIPLVGTALNLVFTLLITPFSLLYYYQIYLNLKQNSGQRPARPSGRFPLSLAAAVFGWILIPGLLFAVNSWQQLPSTSISAESSAIIAKLFNHEQATFLEQVEQQPKPQPHQQPESLTRDDYDQLLNEQLFPELQPGLNLGPATLSAEHFWSDEQEPHLWLKVTLAELPNLALAHRHSTRILIDKVLDRSAKDLYDRDHSFEHDAFHWVDILSGSTQEESFGGIRNVYLKQGTRPEQIHSISGQLELNLPLGIESLQLNRNDIGKTIQVAGKTLTLETINKDGVTVSYLGEPSELLSIRAVNQRSEPLREAGSTWLKKGSNSRFKQMFAGDIDSVTILVASDSITRSYPFEITR